MPKPSTRKKVAQNKARETQVAQSTAEKKKLTPAQYTRRRALGWAIVAAGVIVAVTHWGAHLGFLYEDTGLWDLTIGYPTAALLGIGGSIVLGR